MCTKTYYKGLDVEWRNDKDSRFSNFILFSIFRCFLIYFILNLKSRLNPGQNPNNGPISEAFLPFSIIQIFVGAVLKNDKNEA